MASWFGSRKLGHEQSNVAKSFNDAEAKVGSDVVPLSEGRTWTAAAPSPSYALVNALKTRAPGIPQPLPAEIHEDLQRWRKYFVDKQAEEERKKLTPCSGAPEPPHSPFTIVITEEGSGHKKPKDGDRVRMGYAVALQDGTVLDMCPDFEHLLGQQAPVAAGAGRVVASVLDVALADMKRGQVASVSCALEHIFAPTEHMITRHGPDVEATCEVKLFDIYHSKDCSFKRGAGVVLKETIREGVGAWCHTPTDEGFCELRIEEIRKCTKSATVPLLAKACPIVVRATPGNGELCDALECAVLEMKQHETAIITCNDVLFCVDGSPHLGLACMGEAKEVTFKVTMVSYNKGPDPWELDESDRLEFALRRKLVADRLLGEGRCVLAAERYRRILDLFQNVDKPYMTDKFLGKWDLYQKCRQTRTACTLNLALTCLRAGDCHGAVEACDAVLTCEPENVKALYRRARANMEQRDYDVACRDLQRLLEVDGTVPEARELMKKVTSLRSDTNRRQQQQMKFGRMIKGIGDLRSIKHNNLDVPNDDSDEDVFAIKPKRSEPQPEVLSC